MNLQQTIQQLGRFPGVSIQILSLETGVQVALTDFLDYQWDTSVLVPCDTFQYSFVAPQDMSPYKEYFQEGDIAYLYANNQRIATGIIDDIDCEVDSDFGERVTIRGRDLMGQWEDHDAISVDSSPIYASLMTVTGVYNALKIDTRSPGLRLQNAPVKGYLFATEPGESKLTALQRYLEPLNCVAWMDPDGAMVIGRPNMSQSPIDRFFLDKKNRQSNVINIKSQASAATIPNIIVPVWNGQELVVNRTPKSQWLQNAADGPSRLLSLNHRLPKSIVVSNPQGNSPQELSQNNLLRIAGSATLLQAYASREVARQNVREKIVQVTLYGHYNQDGSPYMKDTTYQIYFDRADIDETMYCYQTSYSFKPEGGQRTNLFFTRLGTIVGDVIAP